MANNVEQLFGDYAPTINPAYTKTPWQGFSSLAQSVVLAEGCTSTACVNYNSTDLRTKVTGSDLVIICLGTG